MILYTPVPPEFTVEHTLERMARLDRRFEQFARWPADPAPLVQDCAVLLGAHLIVRTPRGECSGDPLTPRPGWTFTEPAWAAALLLDEVPTVHVSPAHLPALTGWAAGVVTIFSIPATGGAAQVSRTLNLGSFVDRLELDFLLEGGLPGVHVLRAHRLERGGRLTVWRMERPVAPPLPGGSCSDHIPGDAGPPDDATLAGPRAGQRRFRRP
ncbi:hypothetical protein HNQ07_002277 [Deinococcus metalli]|uniref:Uncharacterized protein n=1 Tax=Deinococcus metalli TaxID=1141878 RepID=A0A7W8KFJ1_9DEIO|nr:hypothetical protein [Deinococcus metalli]MBB5376813.1 hypothetical protein [Deinococcus metalli]GHF45540.1 hypothetical protein GCM10017781_22420 [Deinococcus metalli]